MYNYYITESGDVVSTSKFFGKFACMLDAKEAAFAEMGDGDALLEFPEDVDPMVEDQWGYEYADPEQATEIVIMRRTENVDEVPDGKWFWDGEHESYDTFYNSDGTQWDPEGDDETEEM